jgi:hypothetical protein
MEAEDLMRKRKMAELPKDEILWYCSVFLFWCTRWVASGREKGGKEIVNG